MGAKDEKRIRITLSSMKYRCYNPKYREASSYGGRGITVCDEWNDAANGANAFVAWSLANGYANNLSIDRIDNDKGYSPDNCRWATRHTQSRNTSRNVWYTIGGVTKCLKDWIFESGLHKNTVCNRLRLGWNIVDALTTPPRPSYDRKLKNGV